MPVLKSNYKIDPEHLDVIDPAFANEVLLCGENEFGTFIEWGRMLRRKGYPCILCDGSGKMEIFERPGTFIPCGVCAHLCPTCGMPWPGRKQYDEAQTGREE